LLGSCCLQALNELLRLKQLLLLGLQSGFALLCYPLYLPIQLISIPS